MLTLRCLILPPFRLMLLFRLRRACRYARAFHMIITLSPIPLLRFFRHADFFAMLRRLLTGCFTPHTPDTLRITRYDALPAPALKMFAATKMLLIMLPLLFTRRHGTPPRRSPPIWLRHLFR